MALRGLRKKIMGYRNDEECLFLYHSGTKAMAEVLTTLAELPFDQTSKLQVSAGKTPYNDISASAQPPSGVHVQITYRREFSERYESKLGDALMAWATQVLSEYDPCSCEHAICMYHMGDDDSCIVWGVPRWIDCSPPRKDYVSPTDQVPELVGPPKPIKMSVIELLRERAEQARLKAEEAA